MPGNLATSVGGILEMHFSHPTLGPIYPIRVALTTFATSPVGTSGDYQYDGLGGFTPAESGVLATFSALGGLWAPYYTADWTLELAALYANDAGTPTALSVVPTASPIVGTHTAGTPPPSVSKRALWFFSRGGERWRIWLRQLEPTAIGETVGVGYESGGLDSRDRGWYNYLHTVSSGWVGRDGLPLQPGGNVRAWWDSPPAPYVVSG